MQNIDSDKKIQIVTIPVGYTHNIENVGNDEMILVIWCNELFDKDKDGEYDTDEIVEEISAFIKDYNDLMIGSENTKSSNVSNAIKSLQGITDAYQKDLAAFGITVDKEDDTLHFDEKSFLNGDMKDAKSLFVGTGSFAYQVTVKATMVATQAENEANKANTYTDNATYSNNHNTGSIFNGIV